MYGLLNMHNEAKYFFLDNLGIKSVKLATSLEHLPEKDVMVIIQYETLASLS